MALVLSAVLLASGCSSREGVEMVFLTRDGCIQTDQMRTLIQNRDRFGMPAPVPPFPEPT